MPRDKARRIQKHKLYKTIFCYNLLCYLEILKPTVDFVFGSLRFVLTGIDCNGAFADRMMMLQRFKLFLYLQYSQHKGLERQVHSWVSHEPWLLF